jgi:thioredoxin reductase
MNIAIIGGGIAGLSLAINLQRYGVAACVFERAPEIRELGVGITLLPHAMREHPGRTADAVGELQARRGVRAGGCGHAVALRATRCPAIC